MHRFPTRTLTVVLLLLASHPSLAVNKHVTKFNVDLPPWTSPSSRNNTSHYITKVETKKTQEQEEQDPHYTALRDPQHQLQTASSSALKKKSNTFQTTGQSLYVAGVNLADYQQESFQLYQDFDISSYISGDESWGELVNYRKLLSSPTLSFYVDKIAQKRWLPSIGMETPRWFALEYAHELTTSSYVHMESLAVRSLLPSQGDYAVQPSHSWASTCADHGVDPTTSTCWLVSSNPFFNTTLLSSNQGLLLEQSHEEETLHVGRIADNLAWSFHQLPTGQPPFVKNVKPGVVVEERYSEYFHDDLPPTEFSIYVIWGRVWLAEWKYTHDASGEQQCHALVQRDGTVLEGSNHFGELPSWLGWKHMVKEAEFLGQHKDMVRIDFIIGCPMDTPYLKEGATHDFRQDETRTVISDITLLPTSTCQNAQLQEEGTRLWMAGYQMQNFELVANTQVPQEFLEKGYLSPLPQSEYSWPVQVTYEHGEYS